jgi:hypothetical protein
MSCFENLYKMASPESRTVENDVIRSPLLVFDLRKTRPFPARRPSARAMIVRDSPNGRTPATA